MMLVNIQIFALVGVLSCDDMQSVAYSSEEMYQSQSP